MRTTRRKPKKAKRKAYDYEGEKVAFGLLIWLNNRAAGSDVRKIVRGLKRLDGMKLNWDWHQHEESHKWRRFKQQGEIVTKRLAKYVTRPAIATNELMASKYAPGAPVEFQKVHDAYDAFAWVRHPSAPTSRDEQKHPLEGMLEILAVTVLEQVVKNGWLWKLRVCENCERWFWARKNNQLCCSGTRCRQKLWDSSPVNAERRRTRRAALKSSRTT